MNQLKQVIMELINDGKEMDVSELLTTEFEEFELKQVSHNAVKQQKMQYIRNTIRSTAKSMGEKVRNIRKNAYKVMTTKEDYQAEDEKNIREMNRVTKKFHDHRAIMIEKGFVFQQKMELSFKAGETNVKDSGKDQARELVGTSK